MKYIRTKDGKICLLYEDLFTKGVWWFETKERSLQISCIPNDLGKVADTIEELCDEFVWVSIDNEYSKRKANLYGLKTSKMQVNCSQIKCIYGAIWTDKGLIYVAKMNDKGELELL